MDCTGSKKSFKVAEALEKKGLINDAANYYLESLQRKPSNIDARVKLQNIGQKHVYNMASDFFRNLNTQQTESSLEIFEKLKDFTSKAAALNVALDYPKSYEDDYQKTIETYCAKNYAQAYAMVNQKKYSSTGLHCGSCYARLCGACPSGGYCAQRPSRAGHGAGIQTR